MLSNLRDQLRERADFLQESDALMGVGGAAIIRETAALMRRAADTIWELRNDYVKLRDENERLRMNADPTAGELRRVREALEKDRDKLLAECQHSQRLAENLEAGERENDQLRKLVRDMRDCARDNQCSRCYFVSGKCAFADRMRKLGVEVDE